MKRMIKRLMVAWPVLLGLLLRAAGGQGAPAAAAGGPGLEELKQQYEALFTDLQRQDHEAAKTFKQRYLAELGKLEDALQAAGNQLTAVLAVHGEKERFERTGIIPDSALSADLSALRKLQDAWRAQTAAWPREYAQRIVTTSERYLQSLANLQKTLAAKNDTAGVEAVKASKEKLLNNQLIRQALAVVQQSKPEPPPVKEPPSEPPSAPAPTAEVVEVDDYKFYPPGKEPPLKNLQPWRLDFPSAERRPAQFLYDVRASLVADKSTRSATPRITLTAKNREIPSGSTLVLEYYYRSGGRMVNIYRERTEQITLPKFARGQTYIVDGKGPSLGHYYYYYGSRDFYGLILSVFDNDGKLLWQQCGPSMLAAKCTDKRPE